MVVRVLWGLGVLMLLGDVLAQARASEPTIQVEVQPISFEGLLTGEAGRPAYPPLDFTVGTPVRICVTASHAGFISLWSRDAEGTTVRIYPNDYAHPREPGAPVRPGRQCFGENGDFSLSVTEPLGPSEVFVHWTLRKEDNLAANAYESPGARHTKARQRTVQAKGKESIFNYNVVKR